MVLISLIREKKHLVTGCCTRIKQKSKKDENVSLIAKATIKDFSEKEMKVRYEKDEDLVVSVLKITNLGVRSCLKADDDHVVNTRAFILEGLKQIPEGSDIIVCGAQYFGEETVEPIFELAKKGLSVILLDVDIETPKKIKELIGKKDKDLAQKIIPLKCDFLGLTLINEVTILSKEKDLTKEQVIKKLNTIYENRKPNWVNEEGKPLKAKYLIHSLVVSELYTHFINIILSLFPVFENTLTGDIIDLVNNIIRSHIQHDFDLFTDKGALIYYANTVVPQLSEDELFMKGGKFTHLRALDALKQLGVTLKQKDWDWNEKGLPVNAFLLRKK